MAKRSTKGTGTSKIRFIMLDAEMPEGDLSEITAAIQNALRPATVVNTRQVGKPVQMLSSDEDDQEEVADFEDADVEPASKPAAKRRPAKRKVVDLDLDSDVSLASFAEKYPPKSDQERFLVALLWMKEHRPDLDAISADHLFTAFRRMEWPSGAKDFTQPLRTLKKDQFVDSESRGSYVINHVGEARVKKLAED